MSLLTDQELARICNGWPGNAEKAARAIEQAVIAKLATVSVEPVLVTSKLGELCTFSSLSVNKGDKLVPVEALAAARVQALEEAAKRIDHLGQASLSVLASLA